MKTSEQTFLVYRDVEPISGKLYKRQMTKGDEFTMDFTPGNRGPKKVWNCENVPAWLARRFKGLDTWKVLPMREKKDGIKDEDEDETPSEKVK